MKQNSNFKKLFLLALTILIMVLVFIWEKNVQPGQSTKKDQQNVSEMFFAVLYVFDGDTFSVRINGKEETVRAIGIDSPETGEKYRKKECFGIEATKKAVEILKGKKVRLEKDPTQADRDKYDRLLRYVFLQDGTLFNQKMIEQGFAEEYTFQNLEYKYQKDFKNSEKKAQEQKLGLWGDCQ